MPHDPGTDNLRIYWKMPYLSKADTIEDPSSIKELWRPSHPERTMLYQFKTLVEQKYKISLHTYHDLWQWSVTQTAEFWEEVWHYTAIKSQKSYTEVSPLNAPLFPKPSFFSGARLNFAENLLYPAHCLGDDTIAIIAATEKTRQSVTWRDLREQVRQCANALRECGINSGDRVTAFVGNHVSAVVVMLAATSLGAIFSSVSPDTGVHAVLERFRQIEPKIFFADNATFYNDKIHETHAKVRDIINDLPNLKYAVIIESVSGHTFDLATVRPREGKAVTYGDFISTVKDQTALLQFEAVEPDHPVYILYSSGTTGAPKPIVHGTLGTLIQHKKEHVLHCDIHPDDRLFYFTTTSWMMWHWLVSGLASGASIIVYDGSPFRPIDPEGGKGEMAMARLIEELQITHFGTSAKYLSLIEQTSLDPRHHPHRPVSLKSLKAIFSTAAPLAPSTFEYVYSTFHPDVLLGSITGGTDIISLFGASCPILPVNRGEIQCRCLGMAITVYDYAGNDISDTSEPGDLVCTKPFPCQPVMFWPPGPIGYEKYRKSYFDVFGKSVWHHGDFIRVNPKTGGMVMLGRSDGVLKPAGVRFGSAEIYNVILKHFIAEVEDSLCVGRRRPDIDVDETVVLFLKLAPSINLTSDLKSRIQSSVRLELSARHVPGIIDTCPEIPVTPNGKKVENAVKQILCGLNIKTGSSVANATCLDWYRQWANEHQ